MDLFEPPNRLTKRILRWGKFFGLAQIVSGKFNKNNFINTCWRGHDIKEWQGRTYDFYVEARRFAFSTIIVPTDTDLSSDGVLPINGDLIRAIASRNDCIERHNPVIIQNITWYSWLNRIDAKFCLTYE